MIDEFKTIEKSGESLFKDRGSKFYGFAMHVNSIEEAKNEIKLLRAKYHTSRHVCFAYRVDPIKITERANDDGEPSNSAGTPILNQIYSSELHNVLVAVVRYFGGTKLGVPGLINAYKTSAKAAIADATLKTEDITERVSLTTNYSHVNKLMLLIKRYQLKIVEQKSTDKMKIMVDVKVSKVDEIKILLKQENQIIFDVH